MGTGMGTLGWGHWGGDIGVGTLGWDGDIGWGWGHGDGDIGVGTLGWGHWDGMGHWGGDGDMGMGTLGWGHWDGDGDIGVGMGTWGWGHWGGDIGMGMGTLGWGWGHGDGDIGVETWGWHREHGEVAEDVGLGTWWGHGGGPGDPGGDMGTWGGTWGHGGGPGAPRPPRPVQCSSPLPGLRTQDVCCRGAGVAWGVHECQPCDADPPNPPAVGQHPCPKGFRRANGSCVDVDECQEGGFCKNGLCTNTRGSFACLCHEGFILDSSRSSCISHQVISEARGPCYRVLREGRCALPTLRNITRQICCCSRVGKAWGPACQRCPPFGSEGFKEICPAGPGYHYSASDLRYNTRYLGQDLPRVPLGRPRVPSPAGTAAREPLVPPALSPPTPPGCQDPPSPHCSAPQLAGAPVGRPPAGHRLSPRCHRGSPRCHNASLRCHHASHTCHRVSPRCHHGSPMCHHVSPRCHNASPRFHSGSLRRHNVSPRCHQTSPRCHNASPRCHRASPRCHHQPPRLSSCLDPPWGCWDPSPRHPARRVRHQVGLGHLCTAAHVCAPLHACMVADVRRVALCAAVCVHFILFFARVVTLCAVAHTHLSTGVQGHTCVHVAVHLCMVACLHGCMCAVACARVLSYMCKQLRVQFAFIQSHLCTVIGVHSYTRACYTCAHHCRLAQLHAAAVARVHLMHAQLNILCTCARFACMTICTRVHGYMHACLHTCAQCLLTHAYTCACVLYAYLHTCPQLHACLIAHTCTVCMRACLHRCAQLHACPFAHTCVTHVCPLAAAGSVCERNPRICGPGRCVPRQGGYTCLCHPGFWLSTQGTHCIGERRPAPPWAPMSPCTHLPLHSFPRAPISLCTHLPVHLFPHAPTSPCTHPFPRAPISPCSHPFPHAPISSRTHFLLHPFPHAPTSPCTHPFLRAPISPSIHFLVHPPPRAPTSPSPNFPLPPFPHAPVSPRTHPSLHAPTSPCPHFPLPPFPRAPTSPLPSPPSLPPTSPSVPAPVRPSVPIAVRPPACPDVDECRRSPRPCAPGRCENTVGSFRCVCGPGYRPGPGGTDCQGQQGRGGDRGGQWGQRGWG
uniref:Latent transforming growth factor beta binding protein 4 n=1 Tax=Anas platyrhynchos TaxID=8839 RepID=A0A8B9T8J8_ANAPL